MLKSTFITTIKLWVLGMVVCGYAVKAQNTIQNSPYEGVMHYTNYDDYSDTRVTADASKPQIISREKVFDEDIMFIPELILEDPNPRNGTIKIPTKKSPCGGTSKGQVFYSAFPGRINLLRWKVVHPVIDGNCTIRLSKGFEDDFEVLKPEFDFTYLSQENSDYMASEYPNYYRNVYRDGSFACGRVDPDTFESVTVKFPEYTCDECTLQFIVDTREGTIMQCADIEIINSDMTECVGACQNEGVCINGVCSCRQGFVGNFCESRTQEKKTYTPLLVIILLILFAIIVAVVCYFVYRYVMMGPNKQSWLTFDNKPRKSRHFPDAGLAL